MNIIEVLWDRLFGKPVVLTVVMGVGMTDCHTTQETLMEQDLYDSCELVLSIIKRAAK